MQKIKEQQLSIQLVLRSVHFFHILLGHTQATEEHTTQNPNKIINITIITPSSYPSVSQSRMNTGRH